VEPTLGQDPSDPGRRSSQSPLAVTVRPVRVHDLASIARVYRAEPDGTRRFHHPFPFDPLRLGLVLLVLWASTRISRASARHAPSATAVLLVAPVPGREAVGGFGTLRYFRTAEGCLAARTGVFVVPELRRQGVGRQLKQALADRARRDGASRVVALLHPSNRASEAMNRALGYRIRVSDARDRRAPYERFQVAERDL
jgi:GNAT superfamily N-acetyltransferase